MATFVVLALLASTGPLFLFAPLLARLKLEAHLEFGALGAQHSGAFEQKWFGLEDEHGSNLLGATEVSSLADLSAVFQAVRGIRLVPVNLGPAAAVAVAALLSDGSRPCASVSYSVMVVDSFGGAALPRRELRPQANRTPAAIFEFLEGWYTHTAGTPPSAT